MDTLNKSKTVCFVVIWKLLRHLKSVRKHAELFPQKVPYGCMRKRNSSSHFAKRTSGIVTEQLLYLCFLLITDLWTSISTSMGMGPALVVVFDPFLDYLSGRCMSLILCSKEALNSCCYIAFCMPDDALRLLCVGIGNTRHGWYFEYPGDHWNALCCHFLYYMKA